jgi:glycosyltransferase involved in cell wall biosynthesis
VVAPGSWVLEASLRAADVAVEIIPSRACWLTYYEPRPWPVALLKWARCVWPQSSTVRVRRFLESWKPDVVHVNGLPHLAGAAAAADSGRPVVWHLREILPAGRRRQWLARRIRRHATLVVAVSEAVGRWVREEGLEPRLRVVPNGVELPSTSTDSAAARRALRIPGDGVLVGLFGQLVPHKGALEFVEAARGALQIEPGLRFVLAGQGSERFRSRIESAIAATGCAQRFHLLEAQPSGEPLIAATDVICLATTTPDPLPRAVLEAMAAAKPVAAFDSGGTVEMVRSGETGLLVPPGDVAALGRAFAQLARDPGLRREMGQAGARRAREQFSLERHLDRMEALFRSVSG